LNFLDRFSRNPQISDIMITRSVGAELLHAHKERERETDRQTDKTKLTVAFRDYANEPKNADGIQAIHSRTCRHGAVRATQCTVPVVGATGERWTGKNMKECGVVQSRYHPRKCMEGLRKLRNLASIKSNFVSSVWNKENKGKGVCLPKEQAMKVKLHAF
jgi:hypothetical protein